MTNRTSGARSLEAAIAAGGVAAAFDAGTTFRHIPARRIRPADKADRHARRTDEGFVANPLSYAPDTSGLRRRAARLAEVVGDRLGMPGRDVTVLASAVAVVGSLFGVALGVTADPAPAFDRQLEVQHTEWLAEQSAQGPVATLATDG